MPRDDYDDYGFGRQEPRQVMAKDMMPENHTGTNKVLINGNPFYWDRYHWVMEYQARDGEYEGVPVCADPENLSFLFG